MKSAFHSLLETDSFCYFLLIIYFSLYQRQTTVIKLIFVERCSFQFYIAAISIHSLTLSVYQFVTCIRHEWRDCSTYSPPATVVLLLFLIAEALLFAIFTAVMLGTQLHAIWNDETVSFTVFINGYNSKQF